MSASRMSAKNNVRGTPHPTFYTKGTNGELSRHTSPLKPEVQQAVPNLIPEGKIDNKKKRTLRNFFFGKKAKQIIPQNATELMGTFNNFGNYKPPTDLNLPMYRPNGSKLSNSNTQKVKNAYTAYPSKINPIMFKRQSINSPTRNKKSKSKSLTNKRFGKLFGTSFG